MKEAFRGLATMGQLSLQLLIPILIGIGGGVWLDALLDCTPWGAVVGIIIGIAAAFRNLYVWSIQQVHRSQNSERSIRAVKELGLERNMQRKEEASDRDQ